MNRTENRSDNNPPKTAPRLVLFAPPLDAEHASALISEACDRADIASIILRTNGRSDAEIIASARRMLPVAIEKSAALLIEDRDDLAEDIKPDGVHFSNFPAQASQISPLKPHFIAGAAGLASRHDAMSAGETGADYVMFGEHVAGNRMPFDTILERVAWWAEIFNVPCVVLAASLDEVPALVKAGADFIALDDAVWNTAQPLATLKQAMAHLAAGHTG
ncbi:MAG TPA: thiamine phosphate synthase [Xanthobacteraceae bacterium]|nr:thiamine phosphate synthase [Xanthobacteraceae bacterium]